MAIVERDGIQGKVCKRCGTFKPLDGFSPRREHGIPTGDGYQNICKRCRTNAEVVRYHANPEPINAANRARYHANREQRLIAMRKHRNENRDQINAQKREYWAANKERINYERRIEYQRNPEKFKEINRRYDVKNKEKRLAYGRLYRLNNRERLLQLGREYYRKHPEKFASYTQKKRANKAQAEGSHTIQEWEAVKAYYEYTCLRCRRREPEITLTRDHIVPLSKGGSDWIDNIQPLCHSCNSSKNDTYVDYRPAWEADQAGRYPQRPDDGGTPLRERRAPYIVRPYLARNSWRRPRGRRPFQ